MQFDVHYTTDEGSRKGRIIEGLSLGDNATRTAVFQTATRRLKVLQREHPHLERVNRILFEGKEIFYRGMWKRGSKAYKAAFRSH